MSGYLHFDTTGQPEIDGILTALEQAGNMYHHTIDWSEVDDDDGLSERDRIQMAAGEAAVEIEQRRIAVETEHSALRQRLLDVEAELARQLARNRELDNALFEERRSDMDRLRELERKAMGTGVPRAVLDAIRRAEARANAAEPATLPESDDD